MVPSVEMLKDDEVFREPTLTERNEVIRGVALGGGVTKALRMSSHIHFPP